MGITQIHHNSAYTGLFYLEVTRLNSFLFQAWVDFEVLSFILPVDLL